MKKSTRVACSVLAALLMPIGSASAQTVFRSTQSANLPTAAMLNGGNWLFEISHRFDTPVSQGVNALWGLDGPVRNRLGLTWAAHDRAMFSVVRTNFMDNVELNARVRVVALDGGVPVEVSAQGGVAWNTQYDLTSGGEDNERQAYAQLIANALLGDRVALGVVPTLLRNPRIRDIDPESTFVLGLNGQVYLSGPWSVFAEWIISETRQDFENDSGAFGFEIRTRGHFFKLLVTNQSRMNQTQVLAGSERDFDSDEWRLGFNITRLLPF
jgi:hypothetical protein